MANGNSTRKRSSVAAVAYYRMSSDKQEASISEQREAVKRYASDNGYRILREYVDEGISGDKTNKREAFLRMHHDACNGRDFDGIICWDQDRFGRFDSMEAGYYVHPLRQAGVTLITVNDGPIDWNNFTGRIMYQLKQEGKHQFLRDLSANVSRGLLAKALRGEWPQGPPPIGYALDGNNRLIFGNAREVKLVRRIFREYLKGASLQGVVKALNREGVLSPRGKHWHRSTVREILTRKVYTGTFYWNQESSASYTGIRGGKVEPNPSKGRNDESDWVVIPNNHPAIISPQKFAAVQDRLADQRCNHSEFSPRPDRYALTGLLWCSKCGQRMNGKQEGKYPFYLCTGHGVGLCTRNSVRQDRLLAEIFGAIERHFADDPGRVERFRQAVRKRAGARGDRQDKATINRLEKNIAALNQKLDRAATRLVLVDDDMLPAVQKQIGKLREERDQLTDQLNTKKRTSVGTITDIDAHVEKLVEGLQNLRRVSERMNLPLVRQFMQTAVDRISVDVEGRQIGKRMRYRLKGGTIQLTPSCCGLPRELRA